VPIRRNGLNQAISLVRKFCKLYAVFQPSMFAYIDSTDFPDAQKTAAKAALQAVMDACTALELFRTIYEP